MPDIDKVLKGLYSCNHNGCDNCPYKGQEFCYTKMAEDAYILLTERK